jgi:hypothetical protein
MVAIGDDFFQARRALLTQVCGNAAIDAQRGARKKMRTLKQAWRCPKALPALAGW